MSIIAIFFLSVILFSDRKSDNSCQNVDFGALFIQKCDRVCDKYFVR